MQQFNIGDRVILEKPDDIDRSINLHEGSLGTIVVGGLMKHCRVRWDEATRYNRQLVASSIIRLYEDLTEPINARKIMGSE